MKKLFFLAFYSLGLWGFLGFLFTLVSGYLVCCANLSISVFYALLAFFSLTGIFCTFFCIRQQQRKMNKI